MSPNQMLGWLSFPFQTLEPMYQKCTRRDTSHLPLGYTDLVRQFDFNVNSNMVFSKFSDQSADLAHIN